MKANHTPGPWQTKPEECHRPYIRIRGTRVGARYKVANVLGPEYPNAHEREAEETRANAALIANAPELLEALKSAPKTAHPSDERGPCLCSSCDWSRRTLELIARTEGKA